MRKMVAAVSMAVLVCMVVSEAQARGPRGGGGRRSISRPSSGATRSRSTPSLSSPSTTRGKTLGSKSLGTSGKGSVLSGAGGVSLPSVGSVLPRSTATGIQGGNLGAGAAGPRSAEQLGQFLNLPSGTGPLGQQRSSAAADRRDALGSAASGQRSEQLQQVGDQVRTQMQTLADDAFTPEWWADHPIAADAYFHYNYPAAYHLWQPATWAALTGWFAWGAAWNSTGGSYYDYGTTIVYEDGVVYSDGQAVATGEEYAQEAQNLASQGSAALENLADTSQVEWMPLGVFALVHGENDDADLLLQLSVSKEGIVAGTVYNIVTKEVLSFEGAVDRQTQRVAWAVGDKEPTVMETGVFNLTQKQTPVFVHLDGSEPRTWLLVRLDATSEQSTTVR